MKDKKIVVVMGGPSSEAEVSRRSGAAILAALRDKGYTPEGLEFLPQNFAADIQRLRPDVVFNAMHGAYGEDGRMQVYNRYSNSSEVHTYDSIRDMIPQKLMFIGFAFKNSNFGEEKEK